MSEKIFHYIDRNIEKVLKEPVGFIRYPFIDPGSVYDGNVWDWDTYWCVYGLLPLAERLSMKDARERILRHAQGNVLNFLDWQLDDGYIPMMIENGKWPEPYLNIQHKNGVLMNMHKPFLCQQIRLISNYMGDYGWILDKLPQLDRYFGRYRADYYHTRSGLYVWADDIMIGMDNDPASFGRPRFSTANIFLNCFMVMELNAAEAIYRAAAGQGADRSHWSLRADQMSQQREALIREIRGQMYDRRDRFYYSVDIDVETRRYDWFHQGLGVFWKSLPIRIATWSGFLPLLAGIATQEEAEALRLHLNDEAAFGSAYGVPTLGRNEPMYNTEATNNPSNWLGPIWLVANYCVFRGMLDYGFTEEARRICDGSVRLLEQDLTQSGCLHEYYDPETGAPVMNGGFINWNILVLNMEAELAKEAIK
ncbi:MAG: trehalase / alfa-L-rhamnosidase / mannosyl oligosaccharide glucosidase [Butyrivibrio sp.]|nr:trehalase / alfa-L-rhamnosidase / mannosyl oligosaccharide glucosidase [Butyrivibrio sp.]